MKIQNVMLWLLKRIIIFVLKSQFYYFQETEKLQGSGELKVQDVPRQQQSQVRRKVYEKEKQFLDEQLRSNNSNYYKYLIIQYNSHKFQALFIDSWDGEQPK